MPGAKETVMGAALGGGGAGTGYAVTTYVAREDVAVGELDETLKEEDVPSTIEVELTRRWIRTDGKSSNHEKLWDLKAYLQDAASYEARNTSIRGAAFMSSQYSASVAESTNVYRGGVDESKHSKTRTNLKTECESLGKQTFTNRDSDSFKKAKDKCTRPDTIGGDLAYDNKVHVTLVSSTNFDSSLKDLYEKYESEKGSDGFSGVSDETGLAKKCKELLTVPNTDTSNKTKAGKWCVVAN